MLEFPEEYFYDEVRDGFFVPAMMKKTWAAELKVLDAVKTLCDRYNLRYYADFGTLLGAVRHGGYIPWDDDLDITMPRSDFMKLIEHADELPYPYQILSIYSSDTYYNFHAVASNNRADKLMWDEERLRDFYGCPYIVNVDIYPLDYVPEDGEKDKLQRLVYTMAYKLARDCAEIEDNLAKGTVVTEEKQQVFRKGVASLISYLDKFFGENGEAVFNKKIQFDSTRPIRNALCRVTDEIAMLCDEKDGKWMDYYAHMAFLHEPILRDKEWYMGRVELPFEITTISAPIVYTAVLEKRFGANYMNPQRVAGAHGYPFYSKQEEYLRFMGYMTDVI